MTGVNGDALSDALRSAARQTLDFLARGYASAELAAVEGMFHHGDDPIDADVQAQKVFEKALRQHPAFGALRIIAIVGEEHIEQVPEPTLGERVVIVDPLDGSKCWAIARMGYCTAALVLIASDSGWAIDGAIIATPVAAYTLRSSNHLTFGPLDQDHRKDGVLLSVLPENEVLGRSLAAVAYKPDDLPEALAVWHQLPGWALLTFGGNPMVPQVITGGLTAVLTTKYTTNWDSVGVLMASATDAVVGDHFGNHFSSSLFRQLFAQVLLTGNVTPIPPLIVAKTTATYDAIVNALAQAAINRKSS